MAKHAHDDGLGHNTNKASEDHRDDLSEASVNQKRNKRADSPSLHRKECDLCHNPKDVLVRCRIDETQKWYFVCTSKCWKEVSGGEIDGPAKPHYKYGGMWKNKHAGVSAKKPKKKSHPTPKDWIDSGTKYTRNDKVTHIGKIWVCRRSHMSSETTEPGLGYALWNEESIVNTEPVHGEETTSGPAMEDDRQQGT